MFEPILLTITATTFRIAAVLLLVVAFPAVAIAGFLTRRTDS
jgi:hypothetical protein